MSGSLRVKEIAGYRLLRELGQGGMGKVFLAQQKSLDRSIALKILMPSLAEDAEFLTRFHREAKAAALFQHPNICGVIDAGTCERSGVHFIAFEFVAGGSLEARLEAKPKLPLREALEIVRGVALALQFAESKDLVHRDVKPDNILITTDGVPKLADLGLARHTTQGAARVTQAGVVLGTPHYMAPEQAMGVEPLDVRADIYALGLVLWRMLAGVTPFDEDGRGSSLQILTRHINEDLGDVCVHAPETPRQVADLVATMAAREPDDRHISAAALVKDIDCVLERAPKRRAGVSLESDIKTVVMGAVKPGRKRPSERAPRRPSGTGPATSQGLNPLVIAAVLGASLVLGVALAIGLSGPADDGGAEPTPTVAVELPPPPTFPPATTPSPTPAATEAPAAPGLSERLDEAQRALFLDVGRGLQLVQAIGAETPPSDEDAEALRRYFGAAEGIAIALDPKTPRDTRLLALDAVTDLAKEEPLPGELGAQVQAKLAEWAAFRAAVAGVKTWLRCRSVADRLAAARAIQVSLGDGHPASAAVRDIRLLTNVVDSWPLLGSLLRTAVGVKLQRTLRTFRSSALALALSREVGAILTALRRLQEDPKSSLVQVLIALLRDQQNPPAYVEGRLLQVDASTRRLPATRGIALRLTTALSGAQWLLVAGHDFRVRFSAEGATARARPRTIVVPLSPAQTQVLIELRPLKVLVRVFGADGVVAQEHEQARTRFAATTFTIRGDAPVGALVRLPAFSLDPESQGYLGLDPGALGSPDQD